MRIPGERVQRTRLIQTDRYVVAVDIELVIPVDDPSEPCYEAETVRLLREVKEHAERGDVTWLAQRGKVYAAIEAAGGDASGWTRRTGPKAVNHPLRSRAPTPPALLETGP